MEILVKNRLGNPVPEIGQLVRTDHVEKPFSVIVTILESAIYNLGTETTLTGPRSIEGIRSQRNRYFIPIIINGTSRQHFLCFFMYLLRIGVVYQGYIPVGPPNFPSTIGEWLVHAEGVEST